MTKLIKNHWLWVGTFWTCTLLFGVWNHHAVDAILTLQSQNQVLRSELTFQQQNARKLERIQDEHSKLFLSAESVGEASSAQAYNCYKIIASDLKLDGQPWQQAGNEEPDSLLEQQRLLLDRVRKAFPVEPGEGGKAAAGSRS